MRSLPTWNGAVPSLKMRTGGTDTATGATVTGAGMGGFAFGRRLAGALVVARDTLSNITRYPVTQSLTLRAPL